VFPLYVRLLRRDELAEGDESPGMRSRLGLAVGARAGRAHVRNRWKRAVREAFRLHRHLLPAAYDLVVGVARGSAERDVERVEEAFLKLVHILRSRHEAGGGDR